MQNITSPLSQYYSLQYAQQSAGLQQAARPPVRPCLQSPLHEQPIQPLFAQPTGFRQFSTRPLAQARQLSNIRNKPLLESDEDYYEASSHDCSERKSPRYGATKDVEKDKTKTVAAVSTGQPVTMPPQSREGEETQYPDLTHWL